MARPAICRQTPKVGAECSNWARSDCAGGALSCSDGLPHPASPGAFFAILDTAKNLGLAYFKTHYVIAARVCDASLRVRAYILQAQLVTIDSSFLWFAADPVNQFDFDQRFLAPGNLDGRNQLAGPNALDTSLATGVFEFDPSELQIPVAGGFVVSEFDHHGNVGEFRARDGVGNTQG